MKLIAFTVKGLEEIASQEIKEVLFDVNNITVNSKRIIFESDEIKAATTLRTVDDISVLLATGQVSSIEEIIQIVKQVDLQKTRSQLKTFRNIYETFSITLTMARAEIDGHNLQQHVAKIISRENGWSFSETDHKNFDIRIFIDAKELFLAARLTDEPIFHRNYRTLSSKGGLRPSIAAAMVRLVTKGERGAIVDNFCGSGTILAESYWLGNDIFGCDIEDSAVESTIQNLQNLGYRNIDSIIKADATHTPWPSKKFDYAISNLPWNKQIKMKSITDLYTGALAEYERILKPNGKVCFLVSQPDLLIKLAKKSFPQKRIEYVNLGFLGQTPTIVTIT